jgi:hypothetical protein
MKFRCGDYRVKERVTYGPWRSSGEDDSIVRSIYVTYILQTKIFSLLPFWMDLDIFSDYQYALDAMKMINSNPYYKPLFKKTSRNDGGKQ